MESTASVSKGVFLFTNGFKKLKNSKKKTGHVLFEKIFTKEAWYTTYKHNWDAIEIQLNDIHHKTYSMLLNDIVCYIKQCYSDDDEGLTLKGVIPSATLLTGISQPDHISNFSALLHIIRDEVTPHAVIVKSQEAASVKHLVENTVWKLICGQQALDNSVDEGTIQDTPKLKKSQCTMKTLRTWYSSHCITSPRKKKPTKKSIVVIIPDFESFNCKVLQNFVMIISSYVPSLPIVLVFGVATCTSALHRSFPYHVSSKVLTKVFRTQPAAVYMNRVLEDVFLTHTCPFHLSGSSLQLLTDVFLFYDFSVAGLIQNIKYCMMEHYYGDNLKSLCCDRDQLQETIVHLRSEDLENVRQLPSFRPYLDKQNNEIKAKLIVDDTYLKEVLCKEMNRLHDYLHSFCLCVRLLCSFVKDMPRNVMGKSVREMYTKCSIECITDTPEFKESMTLLGYQSRVKLVDSIQGAVKVVNSYLQTASPTRLLRSTPTKLDPTNTDLTDGLGENFARTVRVHLLMFLRQIENANTETAALSDKSDDEDIENVPRNRYRLKEKLLKAARTRKIQSEFEMVRSRFVSYLEEMLAKGLQPPHTRDFHEILFFSNASSVKKQIIGSPRGALHTALNNPAHYLQCSCCRLPSPDSLVCSLPDLCVAYKLHLECGRHINLFDWLQAFAAVLRPHDHDDQTQEDPTIRLRFTRAVAELQFLGFIKSSKRKTDHVMRLTW